MRKGKNLNQVEIFYNGEVVSVPKEVADFLEQDRKRAAAQDKRDERHLSKSEFEAVLSCMASCVSVEETVLRSLRLENLRDAVKALQEEDQKLISLRYDSELTMEEMGKLLGVSKMAVSKRLKKLHQTLKSSVV